jgi:Tfp pilus assembly protein PilX
VLIVSLLVIFGLTGLGVVAFSAAANAGRTASTFSANKQAVMSAESGIRAAMQQAVCMASPEADRADEGLQAYDYHSTDLLCGRDAPFFADDAMGRFAAQPEFLATYRADSVGPRGVGYDTGMVFYRYEIEVNGQVTMAGRANRIGARQTNDAVYRRTARGYALIGPMPLESGNLE